MRTDRHPSLPPLFAAALLATLAVALMAGCARGRPSEKPPIHPNPNMDSQNKLKPQMPSGFFANGAGMRPEVPGTVARGLLRADQDGPVPLPQFGVGGTGEAVVTVPADQVYSYYTGYLRPPPGTPPPERQYAAHSPVPYTRTVLERGRERYDIYCTMCHGRTGDGVGIMANYKGFIRPPSYHEERLVNMTDGELFDVITNGRNNMGAYAVQIPVADRWAIIGYLRALQLSQRAGPEDVPETIRQAPPEAPDQPAAPASQD